ncbi:TfuA-like protein [Amycolatopsis minnesotensis]|uniref:TfuA-like core domain-containing protein n=1 Tax=Amycolatopsis minnesotensis TaxID=337894 RepID=A0ABN2RQS0_9PSEU
MRRHLFCGPSLPDAAELAAGDDIEVRPPVAAGDLLRLPLAPGDVVGIVDGYFHQTRAVRHKEIMAVLDSGARVIGAASIGALRAAELTGYGMEGVGGIYRDYLDGTLIADDEVTLSHGPAESGYRAFSEPLVNIRAALSWLESRSLIDAAMRESLVGDLGERYYPERTFRAAAELARERGAADETIAALERLESSNPANRKRTDALLLLDTLRHAAREPARHAGLPVLSRTIFLHSWELKAAGAGPVPDLAVLRICQLFATDYPVRHRARVIDRLAAECARDCPVFPRDTAERAIAHGVHIGLYPPLTDHEQFSFLVPWLTGDEQDRLSLPEKVLTFLVRSFQVSPGVPDDIGALTAMRSAPVAVSLATELAGAARQVNEGARAENPRFDLFSLAERQVVDWFAARWRTTPDELELHALDRGIDSVPTLVASARPYYLAAKYNAALTDFRMDGHSGS